MSNNTRIFNVTRKYALSFKQAVRAIENSTAVWEVYGMSIRDLSLAESIKARSEQTKLREPLPNAEGFGLTFEPSVSGLTAHRKERQLLWQAASFVANTI